MYSAFIYSTVLKYAYIQYTNNWFPFCWRRLGNNNALSTLTFLILYPWGCIKEMTLLISYRFPFSYKTGLNYSCYLEIGHTASTEVCEIQNQRYWQHHIWQCCCVLPFIKESILLCTLLYPWKCISNHISID